MLFKCFWEGEGFTFVSVISEGINYFVIIYNYNKLYYYATIV